MLFGLQKLTFGGVAGAMRRDDQATGFSKPPTRNLAK